MIKILSNPVPRQTCKAQPLITNQQRRQTAQCHRDFVVCVGVGVGVDGCVRARACVCGCVFIPTPRPPTPG